MFQENPDGTGRGYATRNAWIDGKNVHVSLHRFVMDARRGDLVDHENGDMLDCRNGNLRRTTKSVNGLNRSYQSNNKSGVPGVSWFKAAKKWRTQVVLAGRPNHLGLFACLEDAAAAVAAFKEGVIGAQSVAVIHAKNAARGGFRA